MTPEISIRSFTNDQYILDKVFYANFYRLKGIAKDAAYRPLVLDLGAHCGYFSFAAASLGARKVISFEPMLENYRMLIKNMRYVNFSKFEGYPFGVHSTATTLDLEIPAYEDSFYDWANIEVDLGGPNSRPSPVQLLALDDILTRIVKEKVDIMKISIGYAESEILKTSQELSRVENICGEVSVSKDEVEAFKAILTNKGYTEVLTFPVPENEFRTLFLASRGECAKVFHTT